jgi:hypothetical protein
MGRKLVCVFGIHSWYGCRCTRCEQTRDAEHDWSRDCDKCARCGKTRVDAHSWSGCKCSKCEQTRDEGHSLDAFVCSRCGKSDRALPWDPHATPLDGSDFFESMRPCLPGVFAQLPKGARDPVVVIADLQQIRWRGLLRLLLDKPSAVYFSPEQFTGQPVRNETSEGVTLYRAPTINDVTARTGVYAAEREQLVYALCGIQQIPMPLIKMVQAKPQRGMFTVAYFGFTGFNVRHVSTDATVCEQAPLVF